MVFSKSPGHETTARASNSKLHQAEAVGPLARVVCQALRTRDLGPAGLEVRYRGLTASEDGFGESKDPQDKLALDCRPELYILHTPYGPQNGAVMCVCVCDHLKGMAHHLKAWPHHLKAWAHHLKAQAHHLMAWAHHLMVYGGHKSPLFPNWLPQQLASLSSDRCHVPHSAASEWPQLHLRGLCQQKSWGRSSGQNDQSRGAEIKLSLTTAHHH